MLELALGDEEASPDPWEQFHRWYRRACEEGGPWVRVMTLATVSPEGRPSARAVVLDGFDWRGLRFFTDAGSRKAQDLAVNPWAAAVLLWPEPQRQVRVEGRVSAVDAEEADVQFAAQPRPFREVVWAVRQSRVVSGRGALEARREEVAAEHAGEDLVRPGHWVAYRLEPSTIEFWQGRPDLLHDRLRYRREDGSWAVERLEP